MRERERKNDIFSNVKERIFVLVLFSMGNVNKMINITVQLMVILLS